MKNGVFRKKVNFEDLHKHETKRQVLIKFLIVLLIFIGYFFFIAQKYGIQQGFFVTALTWSFFVLCTPIADAGFLIDFPFRLITRIRMLFSEIVVWSIAIILNIYAFFVTPQVYSKTEILLFFHHILEKPFPYWSIIIISLIGTFVSIHFGDEMLDKFKHKERKMYKKQKYNYQFIIMIFVFTIAVVLYDFLLKQLGVNLPI